MATEKKHITRNRVSLSCQTCKRRKVKCSQERPICASCQRAGEECVYDTAPTTNVSRIPNEDGPPRKRKATDEQRGLGLNNNDDDGHAIRTIEMKLNHLAALMNDLHRLTPTSSASPSNSVDYATTNGSSVAVMSPSDDRNVQNQKTSPQNPAQITDHSGNTATSLSHVSGKLDLLNNLLKDNIRNMSTGHHQQTVASSRSIYPQIGPAQLPGQPPKGAASDAHGALISTEPHLSGGDILAPTGEESNALFRSWLWSTWAVYPIVSPQLALLKYEKFNKWYAYGMDRGEPNPDPSFMPFLILIWYTGHRNLSLAGRKKWFPWAKANPRWPLRLKGLLKRHIDILKEEGTVSIWTLAASIIAQNLGIDGQGTVANNLRTALNTRAAQSLGLHSEKSFSTMYEDEAEAKKRVWWEAVATDASMSTVSGTPTILDEAYTDTNFPSELKNSCLGSEDARAYQMQLDEQDAPPDRPDDPINSDMSSLVSVFHLVAKARYQLASTTKKILKSNMRSTPMSREELRDIRKGLITVGKEVHNVINRIPTRGAPEFNFTPGSTGDKVDNDGQEAMGAPLSEREVGYFLREASGQGLSGGTTTQHRTALVAFHKWARITLSMMVDRLDCLSYAPFLKNSKSRMWAVARNCALRACHSFTRKYHRLVEDSELRGYNWAWPAIYHPIHAAIIILVDVHDRPHSDEAPASRAMIDKTLLYASPEKGIIEIETWPSTAVPLREGGEEAWTMLRKLRQKAWHEAGLDPDVLWTEEDQMSVGVGKPLNENDLFVQSLREDIIISYKQRMARSQNRTLTDENQDEVLPGTKSKVPARQFLHPSEVGPGEQISGPVTRGVVDMDASKAPNMLLLRAHQDQMLMPFPINGPLPPKPSTTDGAGEYILNKAPDDSMMHIGELIRKIRRTHPQENVSNNEQAAVNGPLSLQKGDLGESDKNAESSCNFRASKSAIDTAYEELQEQKRKNLKKPSLDISQQMKLHSLSSNPQDNFHRPFNPFISASESQTSTGDHAPGIPQMNLQQQRIHGPRTAKAFSMFDSVPPASQNQGSRPSINDSRAENNGFPNGLSNYHAESQPPAPHDPLTPQRTIDRPMEGMDLDSKPFGDDEDFDWDRWDELFGQYSGFEDMFMDVADELVAEVGHFAGHDGVHS